MAHSRRRALRNTQGKAASPRSWGAAVSLVALVTAALGVTAWWLTSGQTQSASATGAEPSTAALALVEAAATAVAESTPPPTPTPLPTPTPAPSPTPLPQLAVVPEPTPTPTITPTPAPTPTPNPFATIAAVKEDVAADAEPVYLTIDDGPHPEYTPQMLDMLDAFDAKATFFVLGIKARDHPELIVEIVERGHAIANHTWAHGDQVRQPDETIIGSLVATDEAIVNAGAPRPVCFRPPYGSTNQRTRGVIAAQGYALHMWDANALDYERGDRDSVARAILSTVQPGDRVLLHDGGGDRSGTVAALQDVLEVLTARGVAFEALPDCVVSEEG